MRMRLISGILACLLITSTACSCKAKPTDTSSNTATKTKLRYTFNEEVLAFVSDGEQKFKLQDKGYVKIYGKSELDESTGTIINIDPKKTYHKIDGIGASFTETSAYLMAQMSEEMRNDVMIKLFDSEKGIGLKLLRNTIAPSDYTPYEYASYDDMPEGEEDFELEHFDMSAANDQIKITKKAFEMNPDIKLFLSPWTAPLWMKTVRDWLAVEQPKLRRDCYDVYARYLVKCIQGYEEKGVPVFGITAQNEPFTARKWPGMNWTWNDLANFTNDNLRPALDDAGLKTEIYNLDYNWSNSEAADNIMATTMNTTQGIAYHWYSGEPEVMAKSKEYFPDKTIYVTEAAGGTPSGTLQLLNISSKICRSFRSGSSGYILWNMVLNPVGGPSVKNRFGESMDTECTALVTYDEDLKTVSYPNDYYACAHYSKYILKDAVLVDSTDTGEKSEYKLVNSVSLNPNGSMVINAVNSDTSSDAVIKFIMGDKVMEITLPKRSVVTLTWDANI